LPPFVYTVTTGFFLATLIVCESSILALLCLLISLALAYFGIFGYEGFVSNVLLTFLFHSLITLELKSAKMKVKSSSIATARSPVGLTGFFLVVLLGVQ